MLNLLSYTKPSKIKTSSTRPSSQLSKSSLKSGCIETNHSAKSTSLNKLNSESCISSKIEASVSNIKQKIQDLNNLKANLKEKSSERAGITFNPRVRSSEMGKLSKNKALLNGYLNKGNNPKPKTWKIEEKTRKTNKFEFKPEFDQIVFDTEQTPEKDAISKETEINNLKLALDLKEKELANSENLRKIQEIQLSEKEKAYNELALKYNELLEENQALARLVPARNAKSKTKTQIIKYHTNLPEKNLKFFHPRKITGSKDMTSRDTSDSVLSKFEITQKSMLEFDLLYAKPKKSGIDLFGENSNLISLVKCQESETEDLL